MFVLLPRLVPPGPPIPYVTDAPLEELAVPEPPVVELVTDPLVLLPPPPRPALPPEPPLPPMAAARAVAGEPEPVHVERAAHPPVPPSAITDKMDEFWPVAPWVEDDVPPTPPEPTTIVVLGCRVTWPTLTCPPAPPPAPVLSQE